MLWYCWSIFMFDVLVFSRRRRCRRQSCIFCIISSLWSSTDFIALFYFFFKSVTVFFSSFACYPILHFGWFLGLWFFFGFCFIGVLLIAFLFFLHINDFLFECSFKFTLPSFVSFSVVSKTQRNQMQHQ